MIPVSARAGLLLLLFIAAACDPELQSGNEQGGVVTNAAGMQGRKAFAVAVAHCSQYGREVQLGALDMTSNLLPFGCVR